MKVCFCVEFRKSTLSIGKRLLAIEKTVIKWHNRQLFFNTDF